MKSKNNLTPCEMEYTPTLAKITPAAIKANFRGESEAFETNFSNVPVMTDMFQEENKKLKRYFF